MRIAEAIFWTLPELLFTGPRLNLDEPSRAEITARLIELELAAQRENST